MERAPKLWAHNVWIWKLFNVLHASRSVTGSTPGPLSITDVVTFVGHRGHAGEFAQDLVDILLEMDRTWLRVMRTENADT